MNDKNKQKLRNAIFKKLYVNDRWTLRMIAEKFNTNHHFVKRKLLEMGVKITRRNSLKKFSDEHKRKISESRKKLKLNGWLPYNTGIKIIEQKNGREILLKNMKGHLRYNVSFEWLNQFDDIEKLKYLNRTIGRKRDNENFTTDIYKQFIEKFYNDKQFNYLYDEWIKTNNKWIKPSLDHIIPKSKNGELSIENLRFISWIENRSKVNILQKDWDEIKKNINYYFNI